MKKGQNESKCMEVLDEGGIVPSKVRLVEKFI